MADTSRLKEGLNQLAAAMDAYITRKEANPTPTSEMQPEIDQMAESVQAMLARIPQPA